MDDTQTANDSVTIDQVQLCQSAIRRLERSMARVQRLAQSQPPEASGENSERLLAIAWDLRRACTQLDALRGALEGKERMP